MHPSPTDEGSQRTSISCTRRSPKTGTALFSGMEFFIPPKKGKQRSVPGSLWQACNPAALLLTTWAESEVDLVSWQSQKGTLSLCGTNQVHGADRRPSIA